jgi:hypothetical protein
MVRSADRPPWRPVRLRQDEHREHSHEYEPRPQPPDARRQRARKTIHSVRPGCPTSFTPSTHACPKCPIERFRRTALPPAPGIATSGQGKSEPGPNPGKKTLVGIEHGHVMAILQEADYRMPTGLRWGRPEAYCSCGTTATGSTTAPFCSCSMSFCCSATRSVQLGDLPLEFGDRLDLPAGLGGHRRLGLLGRPGPDPVPGRPARSAHGAGSRLCWTALSSARICAISSLRPAEVVLELLHGDLGLPGLLLCLLQGLVLTAASQSQKAGRGEPQAGGRKPTTDGGRSSTFSFGLSCKYRLEDPAPAPVGSASHRRL